MANRKQGGTLPPWAVPWVHVYDDVAGPHGLTCGLIHGVLLDKPHMSQTAIAATLGISRATVCRHILTIRRDGLVDSGSATFTPYPLDLASTWGDRTAVAVLMSVQRYAMMASGTCWASVANIGHRVGVSERKTRDALRALEYRHRVVTRIAKPGRTATYAIRHDAINRMLGLDDVDILRW